MKIEIDVDDTKLRNLSPSAYSQLNTISKKYVEDILDEASRLEATRNSTGTNPEITATIIKDAVDFANKFRKPKKKFLFQVVLQILNFVFSTTTGALFQVDKFNDPNNFYLFGIVFLVAIIINVVIFFNEYKNE